MDQALEITAKNGAEATKKALEELSLDADQVEIEVEVLEKNEKGFLGLVSSKTTKFLVKITSKEATIDDEAEGQEGDSAEDSGEGYPAAEQFLKQVFELMKMSAKPQIRHEDRDTLEIDIEGEDLGVLIGRRGQTLDALQYLLNIAMNKDAESRKRITLDAEGYRSRRISELEELAKRMAGQASERGMTIALRPMSAYERRIIHMTLQDSEEVDTESEGEEPERKVLIVPKN